MVDEGLKQTRKRNVEDERVRNSKREYQAIQPILSYHIS